MRKLLLIILGLFMLFGWVWAKDLKIGVVDLQMAIVKSEKGRKAKAELDKEYQQKKREIDKKKAELEKLRKQLEKETAILSEKAKKEKEREYRDKIRELQAMIQEAKMELVRKEQELTNQIIKELVEQIRAYGKKNGYTLIIEKRGGVIYNDPSVDLTDKMIKIYDSKGAAKK
ncbi:MAG: OmpH family outer membrane protein [Deferribacteres bacterium]|nr:OmpH family outer membrane protein [Deferribacteres bacterium]